MRIFKFSMKGIVLGASVILVANSYEEAQAQADTLSVRGDKPVCENQKGEVIKAGMIIHFDNGDY